jgi:hypothetical protein
VTLARVRRMMGVRIPINIAANRGQPLVSNDRDMRAATGGRKVRPHNNRNPVVQAAVCNAASLNCL